MFTGSSDDDGFPTQPLTAVRSQVGLLHERPADVSHHEPHRTAARPVRMTLLIIVAVVIGAVIGALGHQSLTAPSLPAAPENRPRSVPASITATVPATIPETPPPQIEVPRSDPGGALGEADGAVPAGVTVVDDDIPAVANLDPGLLDALQQAATDAADDGVAFSVTSGWRSAAYQEQLLREAVARYGSEEEAARWVATPDTSLHVSGDAIDLGPLDATTWLSERGAEYGLCPVYRNEPWHYELRPEATDDGCPALYADPTQDPRLQ